MRTLRQDKKYLEELLCRCGFGEEKQRVYLVEETKKLRDDHSMLKYRCIAKESVGGTVTREYILTVNRLTYHIEFVLEEIVQGFLADVRYWREVRTNNLQVEWNKDTYGWEELDEVLQDRLREFLEKFRTGN